MSGSLPPRPNLEWLRKAAKDHLQELRKSDRNARLADAQLAVAREHGFPSWRKLKAHVQQSTTSSESQAYDRVVAHFLERVGTGRGEEARALLVANPWLVNAVGPHPFWGGRAQALHVAIETKRRELFDLLLDHGADVNGSNEQYDDWSPLMLAVNRSEPEMRDELLVRGARVGLPEALMLADDRRVEELLRSGTLPEAAPNGGSLLAFARTPFAIDRLITLGAATDVKDRWGSTPIEAMSRLGERGRALVRHMIAHDVAASPEEYARLGDFATLSRLFQADTTIAQLDSVMMAAVDFRHHAIVRWLLEHGANVNARSLAPSRHTALHSAAWNGDLEMVKLLVAAGADRAVRDEQYDALPGGWAETAIEVSNNPDCAEIVAYLAALAA